jgi:hypothetical protein
MNPQQQAALALQYQSAPIAKKRAILRKLSREMGSEAATLFVSKFSR